MSLSGEMSSGVQPWLLASSAWWSPASPSPVPSWWRQGDGGGFGGSPYLNKLAAAAAHVDGQFFFAIPARRGGGEERGGRSSGCMRSRCLSSLDPSFSRGWSRSLIQIRGSLSSAVAYVLKMENKQPRPGDDAGGPELHRQGIWKGNGAYSLPAFSDELPYILVERRPCFFLPAMSPKGRQCCSRVESTACCDGGLVWSRPRRRRDLFYSGAAWT